VSGHAWAALLGAGVLACAPAAPAPSQPLRPFVTVDSSACPNTDMQTTFELIESARTWPELRLAGACSPDDGIYAELLNAAVVRVLTQRPDSLSELASEDVGVVGLVLGHLQLASRDEIAVIRELATRRCPSDAAAICADILAALARALE